MEAEDSMCLGILMSFKEPDDVMTIISKSEKIRAAILHGKHYVPEKVILP